MTSSPFILAVSAEMVFLDLPFVERVRRLHALGFAVEIWTGRATTFDALAATGARFTSMTGYVAGDLVSSRRPCRPAWPVARESLDVAERLACPSLNLQWHRPGPTRPAGQAAGRGERPSLAGGA